MKAIQNSPNMKLRKSLKLKETWGNMTDDRQKEIIDKRSNARKGQKMTEEQKIKNRITQKTVFKNPELRKRLSVAQKLRFQNETEEQRENRIQKLKLYYQAKRISL